MGWNNPQWICAECVSNGSGDEEAELGFAGVGGQGKVGGSKSVLCNPMKVLWD